MLMFQTKIYHMFCSLVGICIFTTSCFLLVLVLQLPKVNALDDYKFELPSKIFDRNGQLIDEFVIQKRILLAKDKIPEKLKQAFIAIEDNNFYNHFGIDIKRIFGALLVDLKSLSFAQGASTITQQTAKLFLLRSDRKIVRKIKEILLAFQIEKKYEKDEILTLYLNKAYMGNGSYGVAASAEVYFSKNIEDLNLTEYAMLAGLVKAPSRLTPINNIKLATARKNLVLQQMRRLDFISEQELQQELNTDIILNLNSLDNKNAASYFVEEVRKKLKELGLTEVYKKGLNIYTTMDIELQTIAHKSLKKGLQDLDKRHGYKGVVGSVLNEAGKIDEKKVQDIQLANRYNQLDEFSKAYIHKVKANELLLNTGEIQGIMFLENTKWAINWASDKLVNRYNQLTDFRNIFQIGDVVLVQIKEETQTPNLYKFELFQTPINNGGIISLNPKTGEILAMSGGYDFQKSEFNRAMQSKRQPGSAFKPIIYAAALDNGYLTTSILEDTPLAFSSLKQKFTWFPKNYGANFTGNISLRESLYKSKNIPTVKLGLDIGIENIVNYAKKFNITSPLPNDPSISLGTASLTLLELTNVYSVFAAQGKQATPYMITKILDRDKQIIYEAKPAKPKQVISPDTAYIITTILQDVFTLGTAKRINEFDQPIAGKTGTTNNNTDAWFIGYTPNIITGTYIGNDQPAFSLGLLETGSTAAAPIWKNFMLKAIKEFPIEDFPQPASVKKVKITKATGVLDCSEQTIADDGYYEYFKITTAPTECDNSTTNLENNIPSNLNNFNIKEEYLDL